jgi:hypothetical protein
MKNTPLKYKFWFNWQRILNLNFSEFTAVIVAVMLSVSIAYPQLENLNSSQKTMSIEFKAKTGDLVSGDITINESKNKVLTALSLIGIILGPLILLWKFLVESKNISKFYNKMHDSLKNEYEELLKIREFQNSEKQSIISINEIFTNINDKGVVKKNDLLNLKKRITPHNNVYKK